MVRTSASLDVGMYVHTIQTFKMIALDRGHGSNFVGYDKVHGYRGSPDVGHTLGHFWVSVLVL